jgi:hypothetical protein
MKPTKPSIEAIKISESFHELVRTIALAIYNNASDESLGFANHAIGEIDYKGHYPKPSDVQKYMDGFERAPMLDDEITKTEKRLESLKKEREEIHWL